MSTSTDSVTFGTLTLTESGLSVESMPERDVRSAAVKAVRDAKTAEGVAEALAAAGKHFVDPDAAEATRKALAEASGIADAAATAALLYTTGLIAAARKAHPKGARLGASTIGQLVTGQPDSAGLRKRWGRYANALQANHLSASAKAAGKRKDDAITVRQAYKALSHSKAVAKDILAKAEAGKDLPVYDVPQTRTGTAGGAGGHRKVTPKRVIDSVSRTIDLVREVPASDWTTDDLANIRTQFEILRKALSPVTSEGAAKVRAANVVHTSETPKPQPPTAKASA